MFDKQMHLFRLLEIFVGSCFGIVNERSESGRFGLLWHSYSERGGLLALALAWYLPTYRVSWWNMGKFIRGYEDYQLMSRERRHIYGFN